MEKTPLPIVIEDPKEKIDPKALVNFGRVYTVEYNVKVLKVGRVHENFVKLLDKYFSDSMKVPRDPSPPTSSWTCHNCGREVPPSLWADNCPSCRHVKCIECTDTNSSEYPSMTYTSATTYTASNLLAGDSRTLYSIASTSGDTYTPPIYSTTLEKAGSSSPSKNNKGKEKD